MNRLSSRLTSVSTSEMGLHFVIDDLKTENLKLKKNVQVNELVDKESQTQDQEQICVVKKIEVCMLAKPYPSWITFKEGTLDSVHRF